MCFYHQRKISSSKHYSTIERFYKKAQAQEYEEIETFIDEMEADVFKLFQHQTKESLFPINKLVKQGLDRLEDLHGKNLSITGLSTSFEELDILTSGFQPGDLIIIAARPSMGKTALSLNIGLQASLNKKRVAFFSVEMAKEQLLIRLFAMISQIRLSLLKTGNVNQYWDQLLEGASRLSETALLIDDSSHISPFEIRSKARRLKAKGGLDLIIVDYIQLMSLKKIWIQEKEKFQKCRGFLNLLLKN